MIVTRIITKMELLQYDWLRSNLVMLITAYSLPLSLSLSLSLLIQSGFTEGSKSSQAVFVT